MTTIEAFAIRECASLRICDNLTKNYVVDTGEKQHRNMMLGFAVFNLISLFDAETNKFFFDTLQAVIESCLTEKPKNS